jgi:hypothetical protein
MRYAGSGDTEPAELLPISLLTHGRLDFNEFVSGGELPYAYVRIGGRVVSSYPIMAGLLNVPAYAMARVFGVDLYPQRFRLSMITASLICALSVFFLFLALAQFCGSRRQALFFSLVYAFGTCVWSVASRGLWQHGPSLLFLTISLWLLCARKPRTVSLAGLFLALAVVSRPANLLMALPAAIYVFRRRREAFWLFAALAAFPLALHRLYAWSYWGNPFSPAQANTVPRVANFGGNPLIGLAGLLASPSRGLFVFSPIFLFGVWGSVLAMRCRREKPILPYLLSGTVGLLLLYSKWTIWWGGHTFGYRLLIETLPALTVFLAIAWQERLRRRILPRALFFLCLLWSVFVQSVGAMGPAGGFNERMDENPRLLWSIRDSQIAMSVRAMARQLGSGARF